MGTTPERIRRRPETATLYPIVRQHLQTLLLHLAAAADDGARRGALPAFVEREACTLPSGSRQAVVIAWNLSSTTSPDRRSSTNGCRSNPMVGLPTTSRSVGATVLRRWSSTHDTFIARLAALVHRPRKKIVSYFGVFAPAAADRDRVVPVRPIVNADTTAAAAGVVAAEASTAPPLPRPRCPHQPPEAETQSPPMSSPSDPPSAITRRRRPRFRGVPHAPRKPARRRRSYFWHELLRRVFHIQALTCPRCGGPRRLLSFIQDQAVITRILEHLGLPTEPPELAPARPPPERSVHFV